MDLELQPSWMFTIWSNAWNTRAQFTKDGSIVWLGGWLAT